MTKKFAFTKGDFFGGLTAGIVALPLALAFGVQSGMGAEAGLYGAIFVGFFAAIFGGTASQISGPTGPMTVVSAATIASFIALTGSLEAAIGPIIATFVLTGIIQILFGVIKIGTLIRYIPYPVISGFMSGIGVIIILLQLFPAVGLTSPPSTVDVITSFGNLFGDINTWALLFSAATIVIIYLFPKITKAIPSTLVALILVTIASVMLAHEVPVIGSIPEGLPALRVDSMINVTASMYVEILLAALTLAALGAIDSLLTSVVADNVTRTKHNSNQELIGQGIGNTVGGIFGGLPGAGATMRTLVNIRSGGKHRTSGVIHALTLFIVLVGAGKYASVIPNAVLAGILITVGIGILDYKGIRHINKVPRADAAIMVIVLLATVFLDLLIAVGIGMVLASLFFMKKMSEMVEEKTRVAPLDDYQQDLGWDDEYLPDDLKSKVLVKHMDGPLFFGFASGFQSLAAGMSEVKYVIIRTKKVPFMDQTGLYALEDVIHSLESRGMTVLITGLQSQPRTMLDRVRIIPDLISEENIFTSFRDCVEWIRKDDEKNKTAASADATVPMN